MSATPWIVGGVGVGLVVATVLYRRAKAPAEPNKPPEDDCEKLRAYGGQTAVDACKVAKAALAVLPELKSTDEQNQKLNGPPVFRGEPAMVAGVSYDSRFRPVSDFRPDLLYANGGVPIEGNPNWSKCAPGTKSIAHGTAGSDIERFWRGFAPAGYTRAGLLSGDPMRDLFTYEWTPERKRKAEGVLKTTVNFPLPVRAGERAWWVAGRPYVCPAGTNVEPGRDHRTNPGPPCVAPRTGVTPPPLLGADGQPIRTSSWWDINYRSDPPR